MFNYINKQNADKYQVNDQYKWFRFYQVKD
jgi:hypothetical protein